MTLSTYLLFNGNCREVFEFYKSVFGGEFSIFMTFADGPAEMQFPDEERDNVMHVSFPIGSSVLMGSDIPSAHGSQFSAGNNFSITHASKSREETDALVRQTFGRRHSDDAPPGHVLGLVLRVLLRQVRHPLAVRLRTVGLVPRLP